MKECPKCKTVYTDVTLSFCLSDGTPLIVPNPNEEKTQQFSDPLIETVEQAIPKTNSDTKSKTVNEQSLPTQETVIRSNPPIVKKGVSPFWIFATFGLLGILALSGLTFWIYSDSFFSKEIATNTSNSNKIGKNQNSSLTNANSENNSAKQKNNPTPKEKPTASIPPKTNLYKVVGVKGNDVLYIRPKPGNLKIVVGRIPPNGQGIKLLGGNRRVGKSHWVLINYKGKRGWVNSKFIARQ